MKSYSKQQGGFVLVGIGCDFVFDSSIIYEDATFVTNATGRQTVSGAAGVVLGKNDGCTQGGEVVVITQQSSKLTMRNSSSLATCILHLTPMQIAHTSEAIFTWAAMCM